jgi:hypothetical protein
LSPWVSASSAGAAATAGTSSAAIRSAITSATTRAAAVPAPIADLHDLRLVAHAHDDGARPRRRHHDPHVALVRHARAHGVVQFGRRERRLLGQGHVDGGPRGRRARQDCDDRGRRDGPHPTRCTSALHPDGPIP